MQAPQPLLLLSMQLSSHSILIVGSFYKPNALGLPIEDTRPRNVDNLGAEKVQGVGK